MPAYSKAQQLYNKRQTLTAKQRGAISKEVYAEAEERADGCCECCKRGAPLQAAHLMRRWKIPRTTAKDIGMLCVDCHIWADNTKDGRQWLEDYRQKLYQAG